MAGIVIVTHCHLGEALIEAAEFIIGDKLESVTTASIDLTTDPEKSRKKIADKIKLVDKGDGVVILTDMFGGTPSNLSYSFLNEGKIEVISGVNLPLLIKCINIKKKTSLTENVQVLVDFGKKSISLASGILKGDKRDKV